MWREYVEGDRSCNIPSILSLEEAQQQTGVRWKKPSSKWTKRYDRRKHLYTVIKGKATAVWAQVHPGEEAPALTDALYRQTAQWLDTWYTKIGTQVIDLWFHAGTGEAAKPVREARYRQVMEAEVPEGAIVVM
jgi:hypothetical protein